MWEPARPRGFILGTVLLAVGVALLLLTVLWMGSFVVEGRRALPTLFFTAAIGIVLFAPVAITGWYLRGWSRREGQRPVAVDVAPTAWEYAVAAVGPDAATVDYVGGQAAATVRRGGEASEAAILRDLGARGWELAAVEASGTVAETKRLFFKRPMRPTSHAAR